MQKVIITCAVTGSIHTPSMSPHLPITPEEIAADAVAAAHAGASVIHLHARHSETGKPSPDPRLFAEFLPRIRQDCDAILNITTGGGMGMTMDERLAAALWAKPELASMNMGSMNFNISGAASRITEWKHDWEEPFLKNTAGAILSNTFLEIERAVRDLGAHGTRFEFECYDISHLYNLAHFVDRKLIEPPFFVQGVFGILGGIAAHPNHLIHFKDTADRLFGKEYRLSALAAGRHQLPMITLSALLGGNVRVGLEDSLFVGPGRLAESSAVQVAAIRAIFETLGMEVASPAEARAMLATKGADRVAF
ncbi:3-keto-5-aminohexanoate cleavage protein [Sphingobium sp. SCG-1]|uniref:3-keto-5-aminohexanoate cleavage protein n=1 Tax=Sphingobium sp. SCG-1 TaxID=2072936 RepID=UPI000CD69407|nr:3-keto-5-aminohexanoate cleavage protein [Sphingobium sp. SCG-1]AUW58557.1 3-keto-5-aminohexanoate cleavage protein [Sphingobium sp. SCG-1]